MTTDELAAAFPDYVFLPVPFGTTLEELATGGMWFNFICFVIWCVAVFAWWSSLAKKLAIKRRRDAIETGVRLGLNDEIMRREIEDQIVAEYLNRNRKEMG